ncbi:MAG TPA: hypothetical protein VLW65_20775 [Bryobacteraceae bacterium]|nr:hypothetical protein [Bryobacteraceae bacterium]
MKKSAIGLLCFCLAAIAQQPPPSQAPAPQAQPVAPAQVGQPTIQAPPELPKYPDVRMPGEYGFWIGLGAGIPQGQPVFNVGRNSGVTTSSLVTMQGTPKMAESADFGVALGLHNALRFSYFTTRSAGDFTNPQDLTLWYQPYSSGNLISTNYQLTDLKLSFDYLTWPYPVESRRFRLKTLWQVQYVSVKSGFDAPLLPTTDINGNPLVDVNGNPITYMASGTRWYITPTLGLGTTYFLTRNVRLEAEATGFTIPHHTTTWDVDASVNFRLGHFELGAGARGFHFKTSTDGPYYLRGTLYSPVVQIRWFSE